MNAVLFETVDERIAVITINRPAQANAVDDAVRQGLFAAFERFETDRSLLVAILTGAGDRVFSAGSDLKEMAERGVAVLPPNHNVILGENVIATKPVIAAVNGAAYAGGWMMAQMCDLCVASETARFAITEAKVGRSMPWSVPLKHVIPQRIWMELLLTGEPISAQRAHEIGFVNHVVPPDRLMARAIELARAIAANAPLTVRAAKEMVHLAGDMGNAAARRAAEHVFDRVFHSADAQEGPRAFREKRPPVWRGE
jgi:enoyl-CoA hydratase